MHDIIQRAKNTVDQAELFWDRRHSISVNYANYRLQQVTEDDVSEVSLRVVADSKTGMAYAVFPDQEGLLESAVDGAKFGDAATFSFAESSSYPQVETYSEATARLTANDLIELCETIKGKIQPHLPDVALTVGAQLQASELVVQTTEGAEASEKNTTAAYFFGAPFKGAGIGVTKFNLSVASPEVDDAMIERFINWYRWGSTSSTPSTGKLPVILAPEGSFLLLMPLLAGVVGDAVWKKTSPLTERLGEKILSEKLTIIDDPLRDKDPTARTFDDEGVPCKTQTIVDQGVLKQFVFDQRTAAATGGTSTGNGFKRALFGSGNETPITPWLACPVVQPGKTSFADMVKDLEEGLLITNGMGFHSGNYPQGHFAVQAVGFHIVKGEVVGRLDKTMISGNIYQDFLKVRDLSAESGPASGFLSTGHAPYILVDGLQVAGK